MGSEIDRLFGVLKGGRIPRPFWADNIAWAFYSGRCPGLKSSAPLARNRSGGLQMSKLPAGVYEIVWLY
jgi:hypothetical protein